MPSASLLVTENVALLLIEFLDIVDMVRILRDKRSLAKKREDVVQGVIPGVVVDVREELALGNTNERVLDPVQISSVATDWAPTAW